MSLREDVWVARGSCFGVSCKEAGRALLVLSGRSIAFSAAIAALHDGDFDRFETACEALTNEELEAFCRNRWASSRYCP